MGGDVEESLAHHHEACKLQQPVGVGVLQLNPELMEEAPEETMYRQPEPPGMELKEGDGFPGLGCGKPAPRGGVPPGHLLQRRQPTATNSRSFASDTTEGAHEPIAGEEAEETAPVEARDDACE